MDKDVGRKSVINSGNGALGFALFTAWIGALVYFIQTAPSGFWNFILAVLKSFVWPAYVVYEVLKLLGI